MLGIDDGHLRAGAADGGTLEDGAPVMESDGAVAVIIDGGGDGAAPTTLQDGAPIPSGCENVALDPSTAIFVSSSGSNSPSCGTPASPCLTIQNGIDLAHDSTATPNVIVANGTYAQALTLKSGVNVIGGWIPSQTGPWVRDCSELSTTITAQAGQSVTVTASDFPSGSPSKLSTLSIVSNDPAIQPGESLFGVVATGANTVLSLVWVSVTAFPASSGNPGDAGQTGATPGAPCSAPSDAGTGTVPGTKGNGAEAGTFVATGYSVAAGQPGTPGSPGASGEPGGDAGCVACITCSGVPCSKSADGTNCGTAGQPGCGGGGGQPGGGGGGGGSSVALLAIDARVTLANCVLTAGAAGNGGPGGPGGPGGGGGAGVAGTTNPTSCTVTCGGLGVGACTETAGSGAGGSAGGTGGTGAMGGPGGDGAGGDSFSVVEIGNAAIDDTDASTIFSYGNAGDGGNGAPGRSGAQGP